MYKDQVRIVDIAKKIGVSTATVSNVIHGKTKKISDETVRLVQKALEEENYMPGVAKILMGQNQASIVGVIIFNAKKYEGHVLEDPFVASCLNHLSAEVEKEGLFLMVKVVDEFNVESVPKIASMWNLYGLVLIGFCEQDYKNLRDSIRVPFVVYDGFVKNLGRICNIEINHKEGGKLAGEYFKKNGHKKALCISDNNIFMDKERIDGFKESFGEGTELLIIPMDKKSRMEFYGKQLEFIKSFTALFAVSDYYAVELMEMLLDNGVNVPEDISILGFDDFPICQQVTPTLSSIKQDPSLRAKEAMNLLKALKQGEKEGINITIPVQLVERKSTRKI